MGVTIIKPFVHKNLVGKEQEVIDLYYNQMAPILYIADTYDCSCDTINKWLKGNNLQIRSIKDSQNNRGKFRVEKNVVFGTFKFTHPVLIGKDEEIRQLYIDKEYPISEISELFNVKTMTITAWAKKNGLKIRTNREARNTPRVYNRQIKSLQYKFTDEEIQNILFLYKEGYGAKYIAKSLKIDSCVIFRILEENDVDIRRGVGVSTKKMKELQNATIIKKYGSWENFRIMQSKIFFEKYGVDNPMQLEEHFYTQQKSAKKLKSIVIDEKVIYYQGFELLAIYKLLEEGYSINNILNAKGEVPNFLYYFEGRRRRYYPDIYIPKDNRIIEVKSKWTYEQEIDKNLAKRQSVIDAGYRFDFYIMEK
jgi:predicted DNA-binding protein YlxM (UPF0122 family)